MTDLNLQIARTIGTYDETTLIMNEAVIINNDALFPERAAPYTVVARDDTNEVHAFMAFVAPNGRQMLAYFTTDAFDVFSGEFVLEVSVLGFVEALTMGIRATDIAPLPPDLASLGLPVADNAWLSLQVP